MSDVNDSSSDEEEIGRVTLTGIDRASSSAHALTSSAVSTPAVARTESDATLIDAVRTIAAPTVVAARTGAARTIAAPTVVAARTGAARSTATSSIASFVPLIDVALPSFDFEAHWHSHGWKLFGASMISVSIAEQWMLLCDSVKENIEFWDTIGGKGEGNVSMFDALVARDGSKINTVRRVLVPITAAYMRSSLASLGVNPSLYLIHMKLLRALPGDGHQHIHFDIKDYNKAGNRFSVLLFCNETNSTRMPLQSLATMDAAFIKNEEVTIEDRPATKKEEKIIKKLCAEENFATQPVVQGQTMVFRTTVAHGGSKNMRDVDRIVVYALFSPTSDEGQGNEQRFPLGIYRDE